MDNNTISDNEIMTDGIGSDGAHINSIIGNLTNNLVSDNIISIFDINK